MKKHMFEANGEAESLEDSPFRSASLLNIIGLACVWNLDPTESLNLFFGIDVIRTDSALLAVAFLTTAALSRCMDSWIQRTRVAFALCVCGLAGGALNVLSHMTLQLGALSMACAVASCVSIATFQCYFMLSNIVRISRLGMMRSLFSLAFWQALIGMSVLFDTFFSRTATLLALLLFGIVSNMAAVLLRSRESSDCAPQFPMATDCATSSAMPWRILFAQLLMLFSIHAFRSLLPDEIKEITAIGFIAAALIIMIVVNARQKIFALRVYYDVSLVCIELSLLLFAFLPASLSLLAGALADASYVFFAILTFTVLGTIYQRFDLSPCRIFGFAFAMECMGNTLGGLFGSLCQSGGIDVAHALIILMFVPMVCFTCFFRESDFRTSWGIREKKPEKLDVARYYGSMADRCAALARQSGLSRREEDVLILIAQRKTAQNIADELYISIPTVKTHTQHIYKKLGVHSRKELLVVVGYPLLETTTEGSDAAESN